MLFCVMCGELESRVQADSARAAAVKSVRSFKGSLSPLVMVNEGGDNWDIGDSSVFFILDSILEECSMRLVS